jgi:KUP system potassium uptake protein
MGAVVLAITGAEALYADMGHFGPAPIRRAWFGLVFPALTLNYLGQSALILHHRGTLSNPFFLLLPHGLRIPMVFLATVATVIASQAVISGAYSVSLQAVRLGYLPRLTIRHTSAREIGQIYVPAINAALFVAVVLLVLKFGSSARLAAAYGIAVSGTFLITTALFLTIARRRWRWPAWAIWLAALVIGPVEVAFFGANLAKIVHGGFLPLAIAAAVFTVMTTWHRGREIVSANRRAQEGPLPAFAPCLRDVRRVPGTAVFPSPAVDTTPLALRANVEHNHLVHERIILLSAETVNVPFVDRRERVTVRPLGGGLVHVRARFGFQDTPDLPDALHLAGLDGDDATWFLSRMTVVPTHGPGMSWWRKKLFMGLNRHAASPVADFGLPWDRTVLLGSQVPL